MIRTAVPRAQQLPKADLSPGSHQRRFKSFVKRVDKNNEVYYTLAKNGLARNPDPNRTYRFFEMPNLLLDLDAEGTRQVRSFDDEDEQSMKIKWAEVPKRTAVKAQLKGFEEQVRKSRQKAHDILSSPTNVWRITPHDVVSAALHGGSAVQRTSARESIPRARADGAKTTDVPHKQVGFIEKIRAENGIPPHATNEDQLLLQWMLLRYKSLQRSYPSSSSKRKQAAPSPLQLAQALKIQSSLTGIRRLVFQCLAAGTKLSSFQNETKSDAAMLPSYIRDACARIVSESPTNRNLRVETLTFLGNLSERLSSIGEHLGPVLCGLALKLAAEIGSLEATSEWLNRSHHTCEPSDQQQNLLLEDVLSATTSLQLTLKSHGSLVKVPDIAQRQLLFQLLTGIDEHNRLATGSLRTFVSRLIKADNNARAAELQLKLYTAYITLLGQLGAGRTLWKEWRELSSPQSTRTMLEKDAGIALVFGAALKQAVHAMPGSNDELSQDGNLDEYVTMDYHAIEMHDADAWRADISDTAKYVPDVATCRSTLDLPLEACVKSIKAWGTQNPA
ncbi:hypothetical protein QQS21_011005 [Conoideocrella luteorostrata]|uniref:Uncharacterized protein n=1 Tax=Conoideocrella luteorostrata TaxID=1105319 RepID=A0AAJ0CIF9_9HYPO|nr:hypothetical protein QQS21_011005 [Conoideocrella luteorostrata]